MCWQAPQHMPLCYFASMWPSCWPRWGSPLQAQWKCMFHLIRERIDSTETPWGLHFFLQSMGAKRKAESCFLRGTPVAAPHCHVRAAYACALPVSPVPMEPQTQQHQPWAQLLCCCALCFTHGEASRNFGVFCPMLRWNPEKSGTPQAQ